MDKKTLIMGVIGSDCHAVGNKILERFFSDRGCKVINLGVMVSQDEYIDAAIETSADAILISTLYGQGELYCEGLKDRCIERGIEDVTIYVGGNLVIGKIPKPEAVQRYLDMGFKRAFTSDIELEDVWEILKSDFGMV
jgi:methylaspartate mutase sigma subunit